MSQSTDESVTDFIIAPIEVLQESPLIKALSDGLGGQRTFGEFAPKARKSNDESYVVIQTRLRDIGNEMRTVKNVIEALGCTLGGEDFTAVPTEGYKPYWILDKWDARDHIKVNSMFGALEGL